MIPTMPLFSLRMKPTSALLIDATDCDTVLDSLGVMTAQDARYRCRDYFGRFRKELTQLQAMHLSGTHSGTTPPTYIPDFAVDNLCREKMCEWSYRVCDHFRTSREVVAVAFSFLDRFVDRHTCDRTTFKLAAMTAFFIATKLLNVKQISICSLAELSRGEFEPEHIAEMEKFILLKLDWKMNPPTVQAFICHLRVILPHTDSFIEEEIYQRAIFFAEISVYDYSFVTEERYLLAVACILNAIEGIDDINHAKDLRCEYLRTLRTCLCVEVDMFELDRSQKRLWYLYSCSAQIQYEDIMPHNLSKEKLHTSDHEYDATSHDHSPVGVGFN